MENIYNKLVGDCSIKELLAAIGRKAQDEVDKARREASELAIDVETKSRMVTDAAFKAGLEERRKWEQRLEVLKEVYAKGNPQTRDLEFKQRTYNCLRRGGVIHLSDLVVCDIAELRSIRGFGDDCTRDVKEVVESIVTKPVPW